MAVRRKYFAIAAAMFASMNWAALPLAAAELRVAFAIADDIFLAPVFVAEKMGLYREAGLEVRRLNLRGADAIQAALRAGQADIIDASGPAVAQAFPGGAGGKIVATASDGFYGWTMITREDAKSVSIADLTGKTIGITSTHSLSDIAAQLAAAKYKVEYSTAIFGAGAIVPELRAGKVDAILTSALLGLREVSAGRALIALDLGLDDTPRVVSAYVASRALMEQRPNELRLFLAATFQALANMKGDRKQSIELLKEYARIADTGYAERLHDSVIRSMNADASTDSRSLKAALQLAAQAWKQPELADVDPAPLFTNEFLARTPSQ